MKTWETTYSGAHILVENGFSRETLTINGKLQDEGIGLASRSKLIGRLPGGQLVKVCLGGFWRIHCVIYVEDEKILDA